MGGLGRPPFRPDRRGGLKMTEGLPEAPAQTGVPPDLILQLATSFMATKYLIAAVEVGMFEAQASGPVQDSS
jgi:hypothetical protein